MASRPSTLYVFAPLDGVPSLAGRLEWFEGRGRFLYAPAWLAAPRSYALDPRNLPLQPGPFETGLNGGVHGVFADAGPDSWGRRLIERERGAAALDDSLEVLRLSNGCGTGALLFSQSRTRPAPARRLRDTASLSELEAAAHAIACGEPVPRDDLELVFAHGSSLGGARPKALVVDDGIEWIAKFSQPGDALDVPRLEWACLSLARDVGLDVPDHRLVGLNGRAALLVRRFDRDGANIHYLSLHALLAMEGVGAVDTRAPTGLASYFGAASLYRRIGVPDAGARMFERMLFNLRIGNTDDHARNHGLLLREGRWDLSPAFDLVAMGGREHALGLGDEGRLATLENAFSAISIYRIELALAERILERVDAGLSDVGSRLRQAGMHPGDIELALARMGRR